MNENSELCELWTLSVVDIFRLAILLYLLIYLRTFKCVCVYAV